MTTGIVRTCNVRHVRNKSLLWGFDIEPAPGPDGTPRLPPTDDFTTGLISRPNPFPCVFKARSAAVAELIALEADRAEAEAARWDSDD